MAQDFHAAFEIGTDDKHIAPIDEGGVALAAIQGLNQKLQDELKRRDLENAELRKNNEALEKRLEAIERVVLKNNPPFN
jgi:Skp family chaperone for outer membrane proteins